MSQSSTAGAGRGIGSVLLGKYRLDSVLGEGGMGIVYEARHVQLDERVAVKLLRGEHASTSKLAARLVSEARATVRLKSEHVVRILDAGTLEDGQPFIVMEYLQGEDLSRVRDREKQLPVRVTVDYLLQTCEAVAEAHSLGIVHRDLKPANLFLQRTASGWRIKVLDFGISRFLNSSISAGFGATSTHSLVGSPAYASPEQLTTPELVDTRTDIWALGVVGYELLSGKSPFWASSLALVCSRVLHDSPPRLRTLRKDVPVAIERSLMQALQKRAEKRPQTLLALARELAPFGSAAARDSLARMQAMKRTRTPPPAPMARARQKGGLLNATLTAFNSHFALRREMLVPRYRSRILLVALASVVTVSALGAYQVLQPAPEARPVQPLTPDSAAFPASTARHIDSASSAREAARVLTTARPSPSPASVEGHVGAVSELTAKQQPRSPPALVRGVAPPNGSRAAAHSEVDVEPPASPAPSVSEAPLDPYLHRK